MQGRPIDGCSGGQKARLGMLVLRLTQPTSICSMSRPTTSTSDGQEMLEEELMEHQASCLLVSHDRQFVRTVANRFWVIEGKKLREVDGPEHFFAGSHSRLVPDGVRLNSRREGAWSLSTCGAVAGGALQKYRKQPHAK